MSGDISRRAVLVGGAAAVGTGALYRATTNDGVTTGGGFYGTDDSLRIESGETYEILTGEIESYTGVVWEPNAILELEPGAELELTPA